jgi:nucleotide-binding universal stress UspA family protein
MTDDEQRRITAAEAKGQLDPERLRVLIATGGGPNAALVAPVAFGLAQRSSAAVEVLWIETKTTWRTQLVQWLRRSPERNAEQDLAALKNLAPGSLAPEVKRVLAPQVATGICEEATTRSTDIILLGSNRQGGDIGGALIEEVVAHAPCHVAVMRALEPRPVYQRIFVPVDGGVASRLAVEFAHRYAENVGAELTLAMLTEQRPQAIAYADISGVRPPLGSGDPMPDPAKEELERISIVFRASTVKPNVITLAYDPLSSAVTREAQTGRYDLVVLGAENRAIQHRLFFGYDNERLIRATKVPVIVVVPNVGRLV